MSKAIMFLLWFFIATLCVWLNKQLFFCYYINAYCHVLTLDGKAVVWISVGIPVRVVVSCGITVEDVCNLGSGSGPNKHTVAFIAVLCFL